MAWISVLVVASRLSNPVCFCSGRPANFRGIVLPQAPHQSQPLTASDYGRRSKLVFRHGGLCVSIHFFVFLTWAPGLKETGLW